MLRTALAIALMTTSVAADELRPRPRLPEGGNCTEAAAMTYVLGLAFGESMQDLGITSYGNILQVYNSKNGTWTVVLTTKDGMSCILVHGTRWSGAVIKGDAL